MCKITIVILITKLDHKVFAKMLTINPRNNHILWGGCIVLLPSHSYKITERARNLGKGKQRKLTQTKLTITDRRLFALLRKIEWEFLNMPASGFYQFSTRPHNIYPGLKFSAKARLSSGKICSWKGQTR